MAHTESRIRSTAFAMVRRDARHAERRLADGIDKPVSTKRNGVLNDRSVEFAAERDLESCLSNSESRRA